MKKLVIDARMSHHSGIGTYIRNILPDLCTNLNDIKVSIFGEPKKIRALDIPQPHEIIASQSGIYSWQEQRDFLKLNQKADLIWVPHFNVPILPSIDFVSTIHDVLHVSKQGQFMGTMRRSMARVYLDRVRRRSSGIIFVSAFSRTEFEKYVGACNQSTTVIHEGVEPAWFGPHGTERPLADNYIIFVGNVKQHKNIKTLIAAFQALQDQISHHLVIVGKTSGFHTSDGDLIRHMDLLGDRIHFTGQISDQQLRNYVANADLMVFPSLYEGFGLPPLEAMAAGCPTIVSRAASLPEVCRDGSIYFNALDAESLRTKIISLLRDPKRRLEIVNAGRSVAKTYCWRNAAAKTASFLRDTLLKDGLPQSTAA